ncbi:MAG: hypothetical protein ACOC32_00605 [Nanoarchaeota archaeon]
MDYQPAYEPGKILVFFKKPGDGDAKEFMQAFGSYLGYEFEEEWRYSIGAPVGVYAIEPGKEEEAQRTFESYSSFVEATDRMDLKFERRTDDLEAVIKDLQKMNDHVEIPDDEYTTRLKKIVEKLESMYE